MSASRRPISASAPARAARVAASSSCSFVYATNVTLVPMAVSWSSTFLGSRGATGAATGSALGAACAGALADPRGAADGGERDGSLLGAPPLAQATARRSTSNDQTLLFSWKIRGTEPPMRLYGTAPRRRLL